VTAVRLGRIPTRQVADEDGGTAYGVLPYRPTAPPPEALGHLRPLLELLAHNVEADD
jgi:hypothetical protein